MKKYEYMVTYSHQRGTGRICITRDRPIENYTDVESLDKTIKETNEFRAITTDFKLLRIYEEG